MEDVRTYLDPDEVDYQAAALLGPEALPLLDELVHGSDPMLASKAAYLATLIEGDRQFDVLAYAAQSSNATLRVAVASGLGNLAEPAAETLADDLLSDDDPGVRKHAVRSVGRFDSTAMSERVRRVAEQDPEPGLREVASEALKRPYS